MASKGEPGFPMVSPDHPKEPVVWIIDGQQWPRALLRAELIERGFDAVGFVRVESALTALQRLFIPRPQVIVLELCDLSMAEDQAVRLASVGIPVIVLGGAVELNRESIKGLKWTAMLKRPVTLGRVADVVERLVRE